MRWGIRQLVFERDVVEHYRCGGIWMHVYSDDGEKIEGMTCTKCEEVRFLAKPIPFKKLAAALVPR